MKLLLDARTVRAQPELADEFLRLSMNDANFLSESYPQFNSWLRLKVMPGILVGERTVVLEVRSGVVAALLIVKHAPSERKLCTLRVRPDHENKGFGVRLFEDAFDLLDTRRPLLSVSETALPKFNRLFDYFGFACEGMYQGRYVPTVCELSYNGLLEQVTPAPRLQRQLEPAAGS